jgi:23S rRNA G2445 N2-methylase RlmL
VTTYSHNFFVTCARGTEGALRRELVELRIRGPRGATGGVSFMGTLMDGMRTCLHSRVAVRVLLELAAFEATDAEALYAGTRDVDWTNFVGRNTTIAVHATTENNANLRHSGFAALKVKDGVVDMLRDRQGRRPDVDAHKPDLPIVLHVRGSDARLFVDLAGEPLHRRGYRVVMVAAPLKETLAAAVLRLGDVTPDQPFIDPMAGSGTLAIEHALAARRIAPGRGRRMGFEHWLTMEQRTIWNTLVRAAQDQILPKAPCSIRARDIDRSALHAARKNAEAAGVLADIEIEQGAIAELARASEPGNLCTNPPYGERLEASASGASVLQLYHDMARAFERMPGSRAVCLSGNPAFAKSLGRRAKVSHRLWNGGIEARLLVFEL